MARLAGVELADNWKVDYALTRLKGIGWTLSKKILTDSGVDSTRRMHDLSGDDIAKLATKLDEYTIEGDLIRKVRANIKRLQTVGAYRGIRHSRGLPVRGQRTRSNARTKRGKRKTVGAFKKEAMSKQTTAAKTK